jgi:DNA-binding CsgD family transcriptional regulator/tetratricopeptide (TPR) repeat protein
MLVGRSPETAQIEALLGQARAGQSGVLVLRGEAGVGKSALLDHAEAQADGFTVLRGVGVESESELAYAALHQILRPVFAHIDQLPEPQADALRAAFALTDGTVDQRFRVSSGVLGLLSEVADRQPLLCLVDDAQWFDRASIDALLFAARRLEAEAVVMLLAARDQEERPFVSDHLPELRLSALSGRDARQLLASTLGTTTPAVVLEWLVDNANGNPLALVELPGSLSQRQLSGLEPLARRLAPVTSVEQVYVERLNHLPADTRSLLLLAASEGTGSRPTVERAARLLGLDMAALEPAELVGLLHVDPEQVVFRHPLVRSAVYRAAAFTAREEAHRALAAAEQERGGADRAAWHRAAATIGTDEAVARDLEDTAERARRRSGHAAAAAALERAADLTADVDARARRTVAAATSAWQAGQPDRATALLDRIGPTVTDLRQRAEMNGLRGVTAWRCGSLLDAFDRLSRGAEQIAPTDPGLAAEMLADAAIAAWDAGDYEQLGELRQRTAQLGDVDDEGHRLLIDVLARTLDVTEQATDEARAATLTAIEPAHTSTDPRLLVWAAIGAEIAGDNPLEGVLLDRVTGLARDSGAVDQLTVALESTSVQGFLGGDFVAAAEAAEGLRLANEAGLTNAASLHRATLAWLAAVQGRPEECVELSAAVAPVARPRGHGIADSIAEWALSLLDLTAGRPEQAVTRLLGLVAGAPVVSHPFYVILSTPDLVEAATRCGREDEVASAAAALQEFVERGAHPGIQATAARCRALLGDTDDVEAEFSRALELHEIAENGFERARTELLYGEYLRRERRRTDAREQLRKAATTFEALHAEPWAERANNELRATGETARKRDPSTLADLTPQEMQIARLVADGGSNKEVAARLFLSPRTVEYHLRKVFAKLGITSRAELIRNGVTVPAQREAEAVG